MEAKLIRRVIDEGDHLAFTALVRMHQSAIRNFLRRLTNGDHALADDLSQETFLKAFSHIKSFSFKGKFVSWLFQIAYRQFISELRKNKKRINDVPFLEKENHTAVCESEQVYFSLDKLVENRNRRSRIISLLIMVTSIFIGLLYIFLEGFTNIGSFDLLMFISIAFLTVILSLEPET